jgi:hypothetical protein
MRFSQAAHQATIKNILCARGAAPHRPLLWFPMPVFMLAIKRGILQSLGLWHSNDKLQWYFFGLQERVIKNCSLN